MATVCLNMIVRNEAHVITRCLASLKPLLDYWVIVDTGSEDNTREMIRDFMKDIPGELHERPWVNFSHNRTEALELARSKADYLFIIDADETVTIRPGFSWGNLDKDAYLVNIHYNGLYYQRQQLVRNGLDWRYKGVLHEYITSRDAKTQQTLTGIHINCFPDGARSQDPQKFLKDAATLEQALEAEPGNTRYAFYLAQSYRDAGDIQQAIHWYTKRSAMGGWDQETWYSLYQKGRLMEASGTPWSETLEAYLAAFTFRPSRIEPLYHVVKHYNREGSFDTAYGFANAATTASRPADILFVEEHIYSFLFPLECAICAYHRGDYPTAIQMNNRVVASPHAPGHLKRQAHEALLHCIDALSDNG